MFVLNWLARLNVDHLVLVLPTPSKRAPARDFASVVHSQPFRLPPVRHHPSQFPNQSSARQRGAHHKRQALPREPAYHPEKMKFLPIGCRLMNKVQGRLQVRPTERDQSVAFAAQVLSDFPAKAKARLLIQPVNAFGIELGRPLTPLAGTPEQNMQSSIDQARLFDGQHP